MNELAARAWCAGLARSLRVDHITREGRPYLERYYAAGWNPVTRRPGPAVFLHHFVASDDPGLVHSHPWAWSASLILVGGYREERCTSVGRIIHEYRPGEVNLLDAETRHRIDLLGRDCWSLFLAGPFAQAWTFMPTC
jgi:hypothetical protein